MTIRRKISLPLVLALTAIWLLLNQSLAPHHVALGLGLSTLLAWFGSALRPLRARLRRVDLAALLAWVVLGDILRSNLSVARIVLGLARDREIHSGFIEVPLDLRDPHGLAALAAIFTATPGTVWSGLSADGRTLTLHVLDLRDEQAWVRLIKERYERPLRRIFG
jgi:multicomponent K+:H+ antiporter subunit E